VRVAYQGEPGAFSEAAVLRLMPDAEPRPYPTFDEVFDAVSNGSVGLGVVPIENSIGGSIHRNYDLLVERELSIVGEVQVPVVHNLLALPGVALHTHAPFQSLNDHLIMGNQISGNGPVLTLRRIVALIGIDGVRAAANSLRAWPGPLDDEDARRMRQAIDEVRLAGHLAQALRPAGYDPEAVYLVTVLQSLGRLLVRYHFADEAEQIHQLTQPMPASRIDGEVVVPEQPGLSEEAAAYAVLGVDIEALGSAAARHWGLGEEVQHMIRRLPGDLAVRKPDDDNELLRPVSVGALSNAYARARARFAKQMTAGKSWRDVR